MNLGSRILGRLGSAPPSKSGRELRAEIDDELAFHLEQRERELVARGMSLADARAEALRRFGNLERVRAECRRVQWGGTVMLQRITLVILVVLVGVVALLSYQSVSSQRAARAEIEALRAQIAEAMERAEAAARSVNPPQGENRIMLDGAFGAPLLNLPVVGHTFRQASREPKYDEEATTVEAWLAGFHQDSAQGASPAKRAELLSEECSPERRLAVVDAIWAQLDRAQRLAVLDAFVSGGSESAARRVVHLGATDADRAVATRAFELLRELAFVRFDVESRGAYLAWHEANKVKDLGEIAAERAPLLVGELSQITGWNETCALYSPLRLRKNLPAVNAVPEHLREAGALALVQKWARSDDSRARLAAVQWLGVLEVDEVTARMLMLPLLADERPRDPAFVAAACEALVALNASWTWEPLLAELARVMREPDVDPARLTSVAAALGEVGADRTVPTILAWIQKRNSPVANEILGRELLPLSTGVDYDPFHDATWWMNWWSINRELWDSAADTPTGLPAVE